MYREIQNTCQMNIASLSACDAKVSSEIMNQRPRLGMKCETRADLNLFQCIVYENTECCGDVMWVSGG